MSILVYGSGIFLLSFVIHLLVWRLHLPKRQPRAIFLISVVVLAVSLFFLVISGSRLPLAPQGWFEYAYIVAFDLTIVLAYAISYTAIEAESPSSLMVLALEKADKAGLTRKDFDSVVTNKLFVDNRIDGLEKSQLVDKEGKKYKLNPKGRSFLDFFLLPRKLLRAVETGG